MAGIGFRLERMLQAQGLVPQVTALGYGVILAAGQWLTAVLGIAAISVVAGGRLEPVTVIDFRLFVVFAIMLAMITTALVLLPMTRLVADALHDRAPQRLPGLMAAALAVATGLSLGLAFVVLGLVLRLDWPELAAVTVMLTLFAQVWVLSGLAGAVQAFGWVATAYLAGAAVSAVGAVWGGFGWGGPVPMALGYCAGLGLTVAMLLGRVMRDFPFALPPIPGAMAELVRGAGRHWLFSAGALAGALGLWVDKWLVWASLHGQRTAAGLPHAPVYDSAVFAGLLSIIPGLALLVIQLETQFFAGFRAHMSRLLRHATLAELDASADKLRAETVAGLHHILVVQAAFSLGLVLIVPAVAGTGLLLYQQVPVVMLTILAAWFLFLATAASTILIHLDLAGRFAAVLAVFLVGVALGTAAALALGPRFLGAGLTLGCVAAGALAYGLFRQALDGLNYRIFRASALKARGRRHRKPAR